MEILIRYVTPHYGTMIVALLRESCSSRRLSRYSYLQMGIGRKTLSFLFDGDAVYRALVLYPVMGEVTGEITRRKTALLSAKPTREKSLLRLWVTSSRGMSGLSYVYLRVRRCRDFPTPGVLNTSGGKFVFYVFFTLFERESKFETTKCSATDISEFQNYEY